jgi:hypothetical protein
MVRCNCLPSPRLCSTKSRFVGVITPLNATSKGQRIPRACRDSHGSIIPRAGLGTGAACIGRVLGAETLIRESCRDGYSSGKPFQPLSRQNPTCCEPRRRATPKAKSNARAKTLADATVKSHPNAAKCATLGWGTHRPKKQSAKNKNHLSFPAASKAACGAGSNGMPEGMPFFGVEKGNTHTILCG